MITKMKTPVLILVAYMTKNACGLPTTLELNENSNYCTKIDSALDCDYKNYPGRVEMMALKKTEIEKVYISNAEELDILEDFCLDISLHNVRNASVNPASNKTCENPYSLHATNSDFSTIRANLKEMSLINCRVEKLSITSNLTVLNINQSSLNFINDEDRSSLRKDISMRNSTVDHLETLTLGSGSRLISVKSRIDFINYEGLEISSGSEIITIDSGFKMIPTLNSAGSTSMEENGRTESQPYNRSDGDWHSNDRYKIPFFVILLLFILVLLVLITWVVIFKRRLFCYQKENKEQIVKGQALVPYGSKPKTFSEDTSTMGSKTAELDFEADITGITKTMDTLQKFIQNIISDQVQPQSQNLTNSERNVEAGSAENGVDLRQAVETIHLFQAQLNILKGYCNLIGNQIAFLGSKCKEMYARASEIHVTHILDRDATYTCTQEDQDLLENCAVSKSKITAVNIISDCGGNVTESSQLMSKLMNASEVTSEFNYKRPVEYEKQHKNQPEGEEPTIINERKTKQSYSRVPSSQFDSFCQTVSNIQNLCVELKMSLVNGNEKDVENLLLSLFYIYFTYFDSIPEASEKK